MIALRKTLIHNLITPADGSRLSLASKFSLPTAAFLLWWRRSGTPILKMVSNPAISSVSMGICSNVGNRLGTFLPLLTVR